MLNLFRSEFHPENSEEGGIDPLGLGSISERLAQMVLPGLLERQRRPRFLTLCSIGFSILEEVKNQVPEDEWKVDFWEAFEWVVVTGLVSKNKDGLVNLPSSTKAFNAKKKGLELNPDRYLKTPSVFGFRGVYKYLAKNLSIETDDRMGENGNLLVLAWTKNNNLPGFLPSGVGPGQSERKKLVKIVCESLKRKQQSEGWNSSFWNFIDSYFNHLVMSKEEKKIILDLLHLSKERSEVIEFLKSKPGMEFLLDRTLNERNFYSKLHSSLSPQSVIKTKVSAILKFESFARTLSDSFNDILFALSNRSFGMSTEELSQIPSIKLSCSILSSQYQELSKALEEVGNLELVSKFESFDEFGAQLTSLEFVSKLIDHHCNNQKNKSPNGKQPWLQSGQQKLSWMVRPGYTRDKAGLHNDQFVHFYRLGTLRLFLADLGIYERR